MSSVMGTQRICKSIGRISYAVAQDGSKLPVLGFPLFADVQVASLQNSSPTFHTIPIIPTISILSNLSTYFNSLAFQSNAIQYARHQHSSYFYFKSPGGMSSKTYCGSQTQSDKQGAQAFNMKFYGEQWDALGHNLYAFVEALLLSPWNCTGLYDSIEQIIFNNLCGYYFVHFNIMTLQKEFGDQWTAHFLPLVTVQNSFSDVGHLAARCLFYPVDVPFLLPKQREVPIEHHFGECKSPYRGNPKYKDMIIGTTKYVPNPCPKSIPTTSNQVESIPPHPKWSIPKHPKRPVGIPSIYPKRAVGHSKHFQRVTKEVRTSST